METMDFGDSRDFGFWKNIVLVSVFFIVAPITLVISLFSLFSLETASNTRTSTVPIPKLITSPESGLKVFASLPTQYPLLSEEVEMSDARTEIIKQYLEYYKSPLAPFAKTIVEVADKNSIDFRLITAIAQQESNLCKIIPIGSYNCWGWGIHSKGSLGFTSFEEGINTVSKGLREEYLSKGFATVEDIMSKYTPMSNGSWAKGVNQFLSEME